MNTVEIHSAAINVDKAVPLPPTVHRQEAWPQTEPANRMQAQLTSNKGRQLAAFKFVQLGTLVALLWKLPFFIESARVYLEIPLHQDFFPAFFSSSATVITAYVTACLAMGFNAVTDNDRVRAWTAWIPLMAVSILCIHQGAYNDMTFTTAWWTMLWSAWFAGRIDETDTLLIHQGARLSRTILSVIMLGGAVGKWTAQYWSGQVLYEIYFFDRDFWIYNQLRTHFEPETIRQIATWYSRQVIVVETIVGLTLWALPPRLAALVGLTVYASIAMFSNYYLFSVLLGLIALAAVGCFVPKQNRDTSQQ